jgi:membrane protein YdbS with pleckstrin-like domain
VELILSATGKPFSDKQAAAIKAETLSMELGDDYSVVDHPDGGYAVARNHGDGRRSTPAKVVKLPGTANDEILQDERPPWEMGMGPTSPSGDIVNNNFRRHEVAPSRQDGTHVAEEPVSSEDTQNASPYPNTIHLNPAVRSFWYWQLLLVLGTIAAFAPRFFLEYVLQVEARYVHNIAYWGMLPLMSMIGAMSMATGFVYTIWGYYVDRYRITPSMIETNHGIFSIKTQRIEYRHIRQVNVAQGIIGRILGFGIVEVATAAETADLVLRNIAHPSEIQEEIYRRKRAATKGKPGSEEDD